MRRLPNPAYTPEVIVRGLRAYKSALETARRNRAREAAILRKVGKPEDPDDVAIVLGYMMATVNGDLGQISLNAALYSAVVVLHVKGQLATELLAAARFWSAATSSPEPGASQVVSVFEERERELAKAVDLLERAFQLGAARKPARSVGDLQVKNRGSFSTTMMNAAAEALKEVAEAVERSGEARVLYGRLNVVRRIPTKELEFAFYVIDIDELFVRGDLASSTDMKEALFHELGHRLHYRYLPHADMRELYEECKRIDEEEEERQKANNDLVEGRVYTVINDDKPVDVRVVGVSDRVYFAREEDYQEALRTGENTVKSYSLPHTEWQRRLKGYEPSRGSLLGFVTAYANAGGPDENFAEMFRYWVQGKLPEQLEGLFLKTIGR
jgi:hypothetical protein